MDQKTLETWLKQYPTVTHGDDGMTVITCVARLAYVHFDKPHQQKGTNKEPRYSCAVILPNGADQTALRAAVDKAWAASPMRAQQPKSATFKDQKTQFDKKRDGFSETGKFFNCETKNPPDLFGVDLKPVGVDEVYSGCWGRVKVRAQAYDVGGNTGVKFWLQGFQKFADDTKLAGGNSADGFEAAAPAGNAPAQMPSSAPAGW
jgi:hypothetical protein